MSQQGDYKIALNFFRLRDQEFEFTVYRRPTLKGETKADHPEATQRKLPTEEWEAESPSLNPPPY